MRQEGTETNAFAAVVSKSAKLLVVEGSTAGVQHSYSQEEVEAFCDHINGTLQDDEDLKGMLPIDPETTDLFEKCTNGLLLCKLINDAVPDTIDERVLNKKPKNAFEITENNNIVVNSAKAIGCSVVNIGQGDLVKGSPHLILGLIWQIIRIGLLSKINLLNHPELYRLLEPGEELSDLMKLSPEEILLRWFNYHLKAANHSRRVANFSGDIKDSENYTVLLHQLKPNECSLAPMQETDTLARAEKMLQNADAIGCRKFVTAKTVNSGHKKLNLAFVANLFNTHPCLEPLTEEEKAALDEWLFASEGTREARAFALWINSLGVEPFVNNLFEDLRDGLILLKTMDIVVPGIVEWKKVNQKVPMSVFKRVENCNYAVALAKSLKFSLVGIQGKDIADGSQTLTLAVVWQLMRHHVLSVLIKLSKDGKQLTDTQLIQLANDRVKASGKNSMINKFSDKELKTSAFLLDLINAIKPVVDYSLITPGQTDDDAMMNAKYAISVARKIGAVVFLLPEDIVEVQNKLILTFVGAVLAAGLEQPQQ